MGNRTHLLIGFGVLGLVEFLAAIWLLVQSHQLLALLSVFCLANTMFSAYFSSTMMADR